MNVTVKVQTLNFGTDSASYYVAAFVNGKTMKTEQYSETSLKAIECQFKKWAQRTYGDNATVTMTQENWIPEN